MNTFQAATSGNENERPSYSRRTGLSQGLKKVIQSLVPAAHVITPANKDVFTPLASQTGRIDKLRLSPIPEDSIPDAQTWEFLRITDIEIRVNGTVEVNIQWKPTWEDTRSLRGAAAIKEAREVVVKAYGSRLWNDFASQAGFTILKGDYDYDSKRIARDNVEYSFQCLDGVRMTNCGTLEIKVNWDNTWEDIRNLEGEAERGKVEEILLHKYGANTWFKVVKSAGWFDMESE